MSIVATARRRSWLLPAGVALAVAIAAAPAAYFLWEHSNTRTSAAPFTAAPEAEQAPWKIKTFAAGALSKLGKSERLLVAKRGSVVEGIVKDVYDAELLDPRALPKVLDRSFTRPAAASFAKAGLGVPRGAADVRSTTRSARIGVNVLGGSTAAAEVTISLVGEVKGDKLKMTQRSTLWMQRVEKHWQVVGYDVKQGPTPRGNGKGERGKSSKGNTSKGKAS